MLDVLQLADQSLLRGTAGAGIPLNRPLIDHDGEGESWMRFCLCHHQFRALVDAVIRSIPVDDHAFNPPADHVADLAMDLCRVRRTVTHVHVVRSPKPQQQMGIHLGCRAGIEQAVNIDLAHIAGWGVPIGLGWKTVCRARVIYCLRG